MIVRLLASLLLAAALAPQLRADDALAFSAAGPSDSPRLARLRKDLGSTARAAALDRFWAEVRRDGAPLVEPVPGEPQHSWVTFLWRATQKTTNVVVVDGVAAGVGGADPRQSTMYQLAGTDVWFRTYKVRNDAAFTYTLSPNDSLEGLLTGPRTSRPRMDPLNPNRSGPQSSVRLLSASAPIESPTLSGRTDPSSLTSALLRNTRNLQVYTPPGFTRAGERYPLLVVLDSGTYADYVPVPAILDALIADKRIPPLVAVLVGNVNRAEELSCSRSFADFLAQELVPWMRDAYSAGADPQRTIVSGASLGGLAAAFAAFQHPEVFGNVLSQSGSYWWAPSNESQQEWLTRQFAAAPNRPIRVVMSVGAMEIPQQRDTNQRFRDVLSSKGYVLDYAEFNGNHSYFSWRTDFATRLVKLIGS